MSNPVTSPKRSSFWFSVKVGTSYIYTKSMFSLKTRWLPPFPANLMWQHDPISQFIVFMQWGSEILLELGFESFLTSHILQVKS
jgi:hypothetical protein